MFDLVFQEEPYSNLCINVNGTKVRLRAFEHRIYVSKPNDLTHQELSVYVPEEYYENKTIHGYTKMNAPILLPNTVGGYRPGYFERPGLNHHGMNNAAALALAHGFVVVCPLCRGIGLKDEEGKNIGMAPATLVDLKAAVRYLRYNAKRIPGDKEHIITNGTSAGGAMSSLLGVSGNHAFFEPYLKEIGAAEERDDVFASSCYCPIIDLEHADNAYEWEFCGHTTYSQKHFVFNEDMAKKLGITEEEKDSLYHNGHPVFDKMTAEQKELLFSREMITKKLASEQILLSEELKKKYPAYLNSLMLKDENGHSLELDENGTGSFLLFMERKVLESMQKAFHEGTNFTSLDWITCKGGMPISFDWEQFVAWRQRMKATPSFDQLGESPSPENMVFADATNDYRHFNDVSYANDQSGWKKAEDEQIRCYNPLHYVDDSNTTCASHFRVRAGTKDCDTSLAISAELSLKLMNKGFNVDYALPWGVVHSGDYDLDDLFNWIPSSLQMGNER